MFTGFAKSAVEFSLSVPGAFGSVWALWSAADVAISLITHGAVKPMANPAVQVAALGTASAMGSLALCVWYGRTAAQRPPAAATGSDLELGIITKAQSASRGQHQHWLW